MSARGSQIRSCGVEPLGSLAELPTTRTQLARTAAMGAGLCSRTWWPTTANLQPAS